MAEFEVRDSLRAYFTDKPLREAIDALSEVLQGNAPPLMTWNEAKKYNQALLMSSQVRADHNQMLFSLWERTFGVAVDTHGSGLEVEFEPDSCTPDYMFENGFVWKTLSRDGLDDEDLEQSYELLLEHASGMIFLKAAKWEAEEADHVSISFDPKKIPGCYWTRYKDEDDVVMARSRPIAMTDFLDDPEPHIIEMREGARAMVAYLAKII